MPDPLPPAFALDVMLGKTARWLRLLGLDAFYSNRAEDDFLKELVEREQRILLTKDTRLHASISAGKSYLVGAIALAEQLQEIIQIFHLEQFQRVPRCADCNGLLTSIARDSIRARIPPYVWQTQREFSQCAGCGKIFWPGTHLSRIQLFCQRLRTNNPSTRYGRMVC